jgi:putative ABC transport system permease protein
MIRTAIKFIKYDKAKSIGVVISIVVSTFLIGQQVGILLFLTNLMGGIINNSQTDWAQVWVVDNMTKNANNLSSLDKRKAYEIKSIEGVQATSPIFLGSGIAKFENGKTAPVTLIGSEPPYFVGGPNKEKIFKGKVEDLVNANAVSADYYDAATFDSPTDIGTMLEINGKTAVIALQTKNARGFGGSFLFTTIDKARAYSNASEASINAIAVKVDKAYTPEQVVENINKAIPGVKAWTTNNLRSTTVQFLVVSSNIGSSIGSLVIFAILSGFFIIGLTLYSSAMDRIKDYATLKAVGATNSHITWLIITQSLLFSLTGFIIAYILLEGFQRGVSSSGLLLNFNLPLVSGLFILTLATSLGSTLFFAVRTIRNVEPASVFKN